MTHLLRLLGYALCVLPPAIATLEFFPLWFSETRQSLSAIALLLLLLAAVPLFRALKSKLRSPSAWMLWFFLWLFLSLFKPIVEALSVIALISFPTSLLGAVLFRVAAHRAAKRE